MKHVIYILSAIVVIFVGLTACQTTKGKLVGSWHYTKSMELNDGGQLDYEGIDTYNENGTCTSTANAVVTEVTEVDNSKVQIKMSVSLRSNGDWKVNDDKEIVSSPTSVDVKVTSVKYFDPSDGSFIGELTGSDLEETSKEYANDIRQDMLEASTERIVLLQDDKYVGEQTDNDGKKITITYNRVK